MPLTTSTTPNTHAASSLSRSPKARKNVRNPTAPRSRPIALPARMMLGAWSSSFSSSVSGPAFSCSTRGICHESIEATAYTSAARIREPSAPKNR